MYGIKTVSYTHLIVNETIQYVADIYKDFGFDEKPSGLEYNQVMLDLKKRCIENNVQLVDTPTMHLGTDGSRELYTKLVNSLLEKGVEFITERSAEGLIIENGEIKGVTVKNKKDEVENYFAKNVVIEMCIRDS